MKLNKKQKALIIGSLLFTAGTDISHQLTDEELNEIENLALQLALENQLTKPTDFPSFSLCKNRKVACDKRFYNKIIKIINLKRS